MTRKDYEMLAATMRRLEPSSSEPVVLFDAWLATCSELAHALRADNRNFDYDKFYKACVG